ncbi:hypothetical protein [Cryptosporangium arvum]|uniref:hypothetical protein n=1 Tax=Cryptosporangium arvum TaxID=80871 RepID=UPI0004AC8D18|nr:hypothetical protein [Cryptosporangium arvum]
MLFLAPPSDPSADGDDSTVYAETPPVQRQRSAATGRSDAGQRRRPQSSGKSAEAVRMTRGARRSATDFGITDAEVAEVLASPARVSPEQDNPDRTRFSGSGLTVVTGADGTVLHVSRRRS